MVLWWIGDAVLLLVVIPVVIVLAERLLRPVKAVRRYADDILDHGVALTGALDSVPKLVTTTELTSRLRSLVGRYGSALRQLL